MADLGRPGADAFRGFHDLGDGLGQLVQGVVEVKPQRFVIFGKGLFYRLGQVAGRQIAQADRQGPHNALLRTLKHLGFLFFCLLQPVAQHFQRRCNLADLILPAGSTDPGGQIAVSKLGQALLHPSPKDSSSTHSTKCRD